MARDFVQPCERLYGEAAAISALSRTIEIDLRELLGESAIPPPMAPHNDILL